MYSQSPQNPETVTLIQPRVDSKSLCTAALRVNGLHLTEKGLHIARELYLTNTGKDTGSDTNKELQYLLAFVVAER